MNHIAPSIIAADYNCLKQQFDIMRKEGITYLHLDIMDGNFVPSICMDFPLIRSIRENTDLIFDAHIMTFDTYKIALEVANAGADIITIHYENDEPILDVLKILKKLGKKAGIAINPETKVSSVKKEILKVVDVFQIMSVPPGVGGQKFINQSIKKIEEARKIREELSLHYDIEVDGDVNLDNLEDILRAGANIIVSGNAIFTGNPQENMKKFKEILQKFEKSEVV